MQDGSKIKSTLATAGNKTPVSSQFEYAVRTKQMIKQR